MCICEQHASGNTMLLIAAETAQGYAHIKHVHLDGRQALVDTTWDRVLP